MTLDWDAEKFFAGFKPCDVGPLKLISIGLDPEDMERFIFIFHPIDAPDDIHSYLYGHWDEEGQMLDFYQAMELDLGDDEFETVLENLNESKNVVGSGTLIKVSLIPPEEDAEDKSMILLGGWSMGLYDDTVLREENMPFLRILVLSTMLRIMLEMEDLLREITSPYEHAELMN